MNSLLYIAVAACVIASTCASYAARHAPLGAIAHQIQPAISVYALPYQAVPYGAPIAAPYGAPIAAPYGARIAAPYGLARPGYGLRAPAVDADAIRLAKLALALPGAGGPIPEHYVPRQVHVVPGHTGHYGHHAVRAAPVKAASAAAASSNAAPVIPARRY